MEMNKFTLKESDIKAKNFNHNWKMFKISWLKKIELLLNKGRPLAESLTGRLKLQIKILIAGADLLVKRLKKEDCDWFKNPPKLSKFDWSILLVKIIINKK